MSANGWLDAGTIHDIPVGKVKLVFSEAEELRLAVCNVDGEYYAIEDVCTHDGGPLDQGDLQGDEIECPRHGACFNVRTGQATRMPAVMPVLTYPVKIEGDRVLVGTSPQ
jgi:3-phenylpropionate/trans-cinnamate dioxygenase ferredoxin subunit